MDKPKRIITRDREVKRILNCRVTVKEAEEFEKEAIEAGLTVAEHLRQIVQNRNQYKRQMDAVADAITVGNSEISEAIITLLRPEIKSIKKTLEAQAEELKALRQPSWLENCADSMLVKILANTLHTKAYITPASEAEATKLHERATTALNTFLADMRERIKAKMGIVTQPAAQPSPFTAQPKPEPVPQAAAIQSAQQPPAVSKPATNWSGPQSTLHITGLISGAMFHLEEYQLLHDQGYSSIVTEMSNRVDTKDVQHELAEYFVHNTSMSTDREVKAQEAAILEKKYRVEFGAKRRTRGHAENARLVLKSAPSYKPQNVEANGEQVFEQED